MIIFFKKFLKLILGIFIILLIFSFETSEVNNPETIAKNNPGFFRNKDITDGPYIFYENSKIVVRWINKDRMVTKIISGNNTRFFKRRFGFEITSESLKQQNQDSINYSQNFSGVDSFVAISDVHGQFDLFVKLLQTHGVIDANYNWKFGTGHLIVLGDIFDRGPKVTELLWLVNQLEEQARKTGGKVHYLLGNHELMTLNNDLRYLNEKYLKTAKEMHMTYNQFFAENTFFGKWLRKKPVLITINDILFVHAGISPEFITHGLDIRKTNYTFINNITGKPWDEILKDSTNTFLMKKDGPVWCRGYFNNQITEYDVNDILDYFGTKHIIIGHTSFPNILSFNGGKIIAIDSSIKEGDYGEVLIYKEGAFYRGTSSGAKIKLAIETN